jgi:hypothetical protein
MKMVRQWMIKPFRNRFTKGGLLLLLPLLGILSACNPTEITGKGVRGNVVINDGSFDNKAFIYPDSPYYAGGPFYGPANADMGAFLDAEAKLITNNTNLTGNCSMSFFGLNISLQNACIYSLRDSKTSIPIPRNSDRTFIFSPNSPEFYQTNALYHIAKGTERFFNYLTFAYEQVQISPSFYPKSIPAYLRSTEMFWFKSMASPDKKLFKTDYLTSYAQCELDRNASFSPAGPTLCFGGIKELPGFFFIQDPDIVYHELGHALVSVMMNLRNGLKSGSFAANEFHPLRSNLGSYGYDEAGSINEGIADYYSYVMTFDVTKPERRIGEYALGRTVAQARPYSEEHPMHIPGVDETSTGRLSYPQYVLYDPNDPDSVTEDVHYSGQIMTHYLVALTKTLKSQCSISDEADGGHQLASSFVMLVLAETLSELGDLNAKGIDAGSFSYTTPNVFFNNLDKDNSYMWTQVVNQVTYRRFFQVFGKNIYKYISGRLCNGFEKNESEKLMDDYGLLLFRTYNDNGNSTKSRAITFGSINGSLAGQPLTTVAEDNRRKSVLVSKQLIELATKTDENPNRVGFYIIDNGSDMKSLLEELLFKGFTVPLSTNVSSTIYNNNNIKVSPGEVVAIIPNLLNNSNSVMAGVQLIANDWDHVDVTDEATGNFKPCVIDSTTTVDQGGESGRTCTSTHTGYSRLLKNSMNKFPTDAVAPACLVQLEEGNSSRWVSQNEFRKKQGLSLMDKDCLGFSTTGNSDPDFTFNPHECLVRFLPGASDAFFSKIDPQKTYYDTVIKESQDGFFNTGNIMIMEANKWIPPGTKFRCRMRARFNNCSDCYTDPANNNDDYMDHELNGAKPFRVINFDFDIND